MQNRIEEIILKNLCVSDAFTRKVLPYLEEELVCNSLGGRCYRDKGVASRGRVRDNP